MDWILWRRFSELGQRIGAEVRIDLEARGATHQDLVGPHRGPLMSLDRSYSTTEAEPS